MKSLSICSIFIFTVILISGCAQIRLTRLKSSITQIPVTTKTLDIPKYDSNHQFDGLPYIYWHFAKQKERQLGLKRAELSNDSLIFRLWITTPVRTRYQPHGLIEVRHDNTEWNANLYAFTVDFDAYNLYERIIKFEKIEVEPNNEWDMIIDSLYKLKFDILPTDDDIPDYYEKNAGYDNFLPTYSFEYATKNKYRFYQYNNYYEKVNDFWQAQNVSDILDLLNSEFDWEELIQNSLDSLLPN